MKNKIEEKVLKTVMDAFNELDNNVNYSPEVWKRFKRQVYREIENHFRK